MWSLACWPVVIITYGEEFEIRPTTALDWLSYLLTSESVDLHGLISDLMPEVEEFFIDNDLPLGELYDLWTEVLSTVSGRPWWLAIRLVAAVREAWHILGPQLMFHGVYPETMPLAAWLDAAISIIYEHLDSNAATMFQMQLEKPPDDAELRPWSAKEDGDNAEPRDPFDNLEMDQGAFMSLMMQ